MPLPWLLMLLAGAGLASESTLRVWQRRAGDRTLWFVVGVQILAVTAIIYAIGWGVTLGIGYLFIAARGIEEIGARVWRPAIAWTVVGIALGETAVQLGWVSTYVSTPEVHGLAVLMALGCAFVIHLIGTKTAAQEEADGELRASEARFRQLFAGNPQPMWVYDAETLVFLAVNDAATAHYGYTRDEFLARRLSDVRVGEEVLVTSHDLQRAEGTFALAARHRLKDGRTIDVEMSAHEFDFESRNAVLIALQDVTRRNALEEELRDRAFHDSLTHLANRALFADRVDHALRRRARGDEALIALLVADLDGFKTVNDSLGHTAGDELLVEVARRVQAVLRPSDTAARLGGDEFAVLVEQLGDEREAFAVAQRIIDAVAEPFWLAGKEVFVSASIGVVVSAGDGSADELLRDADAAMYQAKRDGKGCCRRFEPSMHSAALARLELESDLRRAIEHHEFVVHYQPVAALGTGEVVSLEALVRWEHPRRGLVPPNEFIPLAEQNGLILDIGRWVLEDACAHVASLQTAHPHLRLSVAVNVSGRQLADPNLVGDVRDTLQRTSLEPSALTLEITESVLMSDLDLAVRALQQLKSTGVRVAIDDFGTGYSSLSSLQHLPVDILKIDKSFIDRVTTGAEADGVIHAILRLARTFELITVAEGVERRDQFERLQELGCHQIQGFWFSRPLTVDQIGDFLRAAAATTRELPGAVDAA
jgi:diguanylate cyclase (GGDEF)-like protein/PAS domain S-box-containing protein